MELNEYQNHLLHGYMMAKMAAEIPVPDLLARIDRAETIGPFLDPTLYREKAGAMDDDKEMLRALLSLHRIGLRLKETADSGGKEGG